MAVGELIIDKASVDLNYLFKSLKIVEENNGIISRYNFVRKMEIYMRGEIISEETVTEISRTQFNKTKLARYYGLLRTLKKDHNQFLVLTKRGKQVCEIIEEKEDKSFNIKNKRKLKEIILYSILYDTFGKNNDGVETSNSDIEPPKILLKAILECTYITSQELIYLIYSLNNLEYDSFKDAIQDIKRYRTENSDFIKNKITEYNKENFVSDNKLISFFQKIEIIYCNNKKYYLTEEVLNNYKEIIKQLNPISKNLQLIIAGNPGTGKTYFINNIILGNIVESRQVVRTIIYPDYNYSDFIGYIRPKTINNKLCYDFEPGPFTIVLEKAIADSKTNYYLVIEEINRGNISSVFGDLFQLLDRNDNFKANNHSWSKYGISNKEIFDYLSKRIERNILNESLNNNLIYLPANLNIILTLNTEEKNNYFLDSAFRRRFNYLYLKMDFSKSSEINSYLEKLDAISKEKIFNNKYTWSEFAKRINNIIDDENKDYYSIPESKKLSPYFVNLNDVNDIYQFCDKVVYYLKNDVFKYNNKYLNINYDLIRNKFCNDRCDFFDILEEHNNE